LATTFWNEGSISQPILFTDLHPRRRINQSLDLDFVRREIAKFHGTKGNVSEDPVVIMKMMLLPFFGQCAQRKGTDADYLGTTRFLCYRLDQAIPNHSVLSKARKQWGQEVGQGRSYALRNEDERQPQKGRRIAIPGFFPNYPVFDFCIFIGDRSAGEANRSGSIQCRCFSFSPMIHVATEKPSSQRFSGLSEHGQ
jgi:hypothetical protein